ncbi:MAG: UDP-N-acetylmuramoyl-L-alanyl-D-glutamate--2,6-diaminopimelate ligase [Candidatus Abyssobacteria bacterium SURF_5]|uniref:UDP-N-acetylmuramoyl-L-alanyl-D-glutamate--2,6-diaminopimelate ligase n=1 Tax=Abyssobacteria bacterium (strain SURF_5) TaxID=2093360 RepID=A0A3A4P0S3_ABYX5|nr:MAG: UDP-N-acetylmuramoyl-L-alanyl-D-glutamate--2,6-diaminopimelate ligase [Candidatus Abyssubacteria bacterium SURF_5]
MMKLYSLLDELTEKTVTGGADIEITGITADSRKVQKGFLFVAIAGNKEDGHRYVEHALRQGAAAVVGKSVAELPGVVSIAVPDSRKAAALLAEAFYEHPSRQLNVIGITGTNGKSSTLYLIRSILSAAGISSSGIGTICYSVAGTTEAAKNTTPGPIDLSSSLRKALDAGHTHFVMEVSSHALHQFRVEAIRFAVAVYTNLSLDHLDYHANMEDYFVSKRHLFELLSRNPQANCAVISADDARGKDIAAATQTRKLTFGIKNPADICARNIEIGASHTAFLASTPAGDFPVNLKLLGRHSVYNALAAAGVCLGLDIDVSTIKQGLEQLELVPGRFERVSEGQPFEVIVDYAHTPEAIKLLLESARSICKGKLIAVFGAGGDRDRSKRPEMGKLAASISDFSIVTSDNPRSEDPYRIALDIEIGFQKMGKERGQHYLVIIDRREAIEEALATAETGDIVVIAGKGHETYQIFKDATVEFDDKAIARAWLQSMNKPEK